MVKELKTLQKLIDTVHCQQLLKKFYLQLCVAPYMLAERMEPPFHTEQSAAYLEQLEVNERAFVVVDATSEDHPITWCSDAFCTLTGYTRDEVRGRNCRMLQSKETDRSKLIELRSYFEAPGRDPKVTLLRNCKKDGTGFDNLFTIYPVYTTSDEGEVTLDEWIGVQVSN